MDSSLTLGAARQEGSLSGGSEDLPSLLAFGRSPLLPGQLLDHPGPALNSSQTSQLLEQLYQLENKPAIQTSSMAEPIDISITEKATHVYVKVHEPRGLNPRFEGPFEVVSRPSRTQVEVKIGAYVNGEPRKAIYNWSSCKIAHLREDFVEGSRPQLGRQPKNKQPSASNNESTLTDDAENDGLLNPGGRKERAKIQTPYADPAEARTDNQSTELRRSTQVMRN